jgi:hypothetical protein
MMKRIVATVGAALAAGVFLPTGIILIMGNRLTLDAVKKMLGVRIARV